MEERIRKFYYRLKNEKSISINAYDILKGDIPKIKEGLDILLNSLGYSDSVYSNPLLISWGDYSLEDREKIEKYCKPELNSEDFYAVRVLQYCFFEKDLNVDKIKLHAMKTIKEMDEKFGRPFSL